MTSPITWFGGKGNMTARLLPLLPPHRIYVEPFGGGASILFSKKPSLVEVYNDLDSGLVTLFRVLRDPDKFRRLYDMVCLTPYSREEWQHCRDTWESCDDEIERAYRFYVTARMSFSGDFGSSWSSSLRSSSRGMAKAVSKWLYAMDKLPEIHARLSRVQVEHRDFRDIFKRYDTPETLFYADPPYVPGTRSSGKYRHDMRLQDHEELVGILLDLDGMVVLSGYNHAVYAPLERAGWCRIDIPTSCYAAGRTRQIGIIGEGAAERSQPRVESVWLNPQAQERGAVNGALKFSAGGGVCGNDG